MALVRRVRPRMAGMVVVVSLLGVSCAGSGATYVTSRSTGTFLKVPDGWKVFKQDEIRSRVDTGGSPPYPFLAAFDADPRPSLAHTFSDARYPWGLVRVRDLGLAEHDAFSLASLRNEVVHVDDLEQSDPSAVQVLSPPKLVTHRGLRGTRLEYSVHADGTEFTVVQAGYVDEATHRVWLLILGCDTSCFHRNSTAIHRVADSWIVQGR